MKPLSLSLMVFATLVSSMALAADTVKIKAGGHTIEFPCSEIADDTDLTCQEFCDEIDAQDGVSCEVVDGVMYVESDEWVSPVALQRSANDESPPEPKPTPTRARTGR